jgi:hypothetical protein
MWSSLEVLMSSAARVQILRLFLLNPARPFYQREIGRATGQPIRAVQREMDRLAGIDLLIRRTEANRVFYCLNAEFPLLHELIALFVKAAGSETVAAPETRGAGGSPPPAPESSTRQQPFPWMEAPAAGALPEKLRERQTRGEWDRAY